MAIYGSTEHLKRDTAPGFAFEETWSPGDRPMVAGVYRCRCGYEWPLRDDEALPGAEHRHQPSQGAALWQLLLITEAPRVVALPKQVRLKAAPRRNEAFDGRLF